jgi:hypothetical protein
LIFYLLVNFWLFRTISFKRAAKVAIVMVNQKLKTKHLLRYIRKNANFFFDKVTKDQLIEKQWQNFY